MSGELPVSLAQLNAAMQKRTGQSWNKRFKKRNGALLAFVLDNLHIFSVNEAEEIGLARAALACPIGETKSIKKETAEPLEGADHVAATTSGADGEAWFNVNDSQVTCVTDKALAEQYSGRECAYMLFYVRRSFLAETRDIVPEPPAWLKTAVDAENAALRQQRETYDEIAHRVKLYIVSAGAFTVDHNVLEAKMDEGLAAECGLAAVRSGYFSS